MESTIGPERELKILAETERLKQKSESILERMEGLRNRLIPYMSNECTASDERLQAKNPEEESATYLLKLVGIRKNIMEVICLLDEIDVRLEL